MQKKNSITLVDTDEFTVTISTHMKCEGTFFNATKIAAQFNMGNKKVTEFLRSRPFSNFLDANEKCFKDVAITKRGKGGGTWLHKDLALEFTIYMLQEGAPKHGALYVIQRNNLVKIGISINPRKRIQTIGSHYFDKIENQYVSPIIQDHAVIEKKVHSFFKEKRKYGEWFSVGFNEAVDRIESLIDKTSAQV